METQEQEANRKPEEEQKQEEGQKAEEKEKPKENRPGTYTFHSKPVEQNTNIPGLGVDFNCGMRVRVPEGDGWGVRAVDLDTDFTIDIPNVPSGQTTQSLKVYFIRWKVEVYRNKELVYEHSYDAKDRDVAFEICSFALGDTLAFVPYVRKFKEVHGCRRVYVRAEKYMADLLAQHYPDLEFIPRGTYPDGVYATYYIGNFYPSTDRKLQPYTWHVVGLQGCAYSILGLPEEEIPPVLKPLKKREIKEPYVCISAQASAQCKYWLNPTGWMDTIKYLKEQGYRVLCIDGERWKGTGDVKNTIPWGAEDFTGKIPLQERVNLLAYADFFIGLGSGLSWLAWGSGTPVVMISGFSTPHFEFRTPYRVINLNVCTGCLNDGQHDFDMNSFDSCPRYQDDPKNRYQCTKAITSAHVNRTIRRLMQDYHLDPKHRKMRVED